MLDLRGQKFTADYTYRMSSSASMLLCLPHVLVQVAHEHSETLHSAVGRHSSVDGNVLHQSKVSTCLLRQTCNTNTQLTDEWSKSSICSFQTIVFGQSPTCVIVFWGEHCRLSVCSIPVRVQSSGTRRMGESSPPRARMSLFFGLLTRRGW